MNIGEIKYVITKEQYESFVHYKEMFRHNAENLKELCKEDRSDINLGFELGYVNKHLWDCFREMQDLLEDVYEQDFDPILKKIDKKSNTATNKDI